jgi:hypothetical protein
MQSRRRRKNKQTNKQINKQINKKINPRNRVLFEKITVNVFAPMGFYAA